MSDQNERLIQVYDEQGNQIPRKGVRWDELISKGILHAAAHVWVWRHTKDGRIIEVLLQKRSNDMNTWPGRFDISAAGHVDLGERPVDAAIREVSEEIGLNVQPSDLRCIGIERRYQVSNQNTAIENEFNYLYLLEQTHTQTLHPSEKEVTKVVWKELGEFEREAIADEPGDIYVPHGELYYRTVVSHIKRLASNNGVLA